MLRRYITLGLAMLTGATLSAAAVSGLHAQGNALGAYAILDIYEITEAPFQSIEEHEDVSPSILFVCGAVQAPAHVTIDNDVPPEFTWPVRGPVVQDTCSNSSDQHYDGISIAAPEGANVKAAADGVVAYAGDELKGYGNLVVIRHSNGWMTAYAFNSELSVKRGDQVRRGQSIAVVGRIGAMAFPQLHFEIRRGSESINPLDYLPNRYLK